MKPLGLSNRGLRRARSMARRREHPIQQQIRTAISSSRKIAARMMGSRLTVRKLIDLWRIVYIFW